MQRSARPTRRQWSMGLLVVACVVALVAAVLVVGPATQASGTRERVVTVARGVVQATVSGTGTVAPARQLDVDFDTGGELTHVYVKPGQHVVAGQVLAQIDATDAQASVDQAQASLAAAEAATVATSSAASASTATVPANTTPARTTPTTTTPTTTTPARGGGSGGSASGGGETSAQKAANVASAQAALDQAQATLAATTLRAPMTGTVASVNGAVGEQVSGGGSSAASSSGGSGSSGSGGGSGGGGSGSGGNGNSGSGSGSGSSAFVVLADLDALDVVVPFSESDVGKLRVGQAATVSVNALPNQQLAAHVVSIATLATSDSGVVSYDVTLRLDQLAHGLKPGMTASAEVVVQRAGDALNVTGEAVSGRGANASVTLVQGDKRVRRAVITGVIGDSMTQILGGLRAGDQVAIVSALPSSSALSGLAAAGGGATGTLGGGRLGGAGGRFGGGGGPGFAIGGPPGGGGP